MSSGRYRLRGDYERETTAPTVWLICALAGAFVIQFSLELAAGGAAGGLAEGMALSGEALRHGRWWTPLTFWLPHSTSNLFHVGLVIAGLLLLGRDLRDRLEPKVMFAVFGLGLLAGAVWWTAINWARPTALIGATAGVYALLVLAARLSPDREFRFLLFFLAPVSFRMVNANGDGDYFEGLAVTCAAPDDPTRSLGDPREASLAEALHYVHTGTCRPPVSLATGDSSTAGAAAPSPATGWMSLVNAH